MHAGLSSDYARTIRVIAMKASAARNRISTFRNLSFLLSMYCAEL